jgi:hypothetical protein
MRTQHQNEIESRFGHVRYETGIATGNGLDSRGVGVRVPVGSRFFSLHVVQTGSGVHPTSCPMGSGGSFLGGKVAGV